MLFRVGSAREFIKVVKVELVFFDSIWCHFTLGPMSHEKLRNVQMCPWASHLRRTSRKRARAAKHFYCPLFHIFQLWFEAHKLRVMRPRSSTMFFHQFWLFSARDDVGVRASDFIFGREHLTHIYYHKSALENRQTQLLSYGSTCDSWTWTKGSTIDRTNCTAGFHLWKFSFAPHTEINCNFVVICEQLVTTTIRLVIEGNR